MSKYAKLDEAILKNMGGQPSWQPAHLNGREKHGHLPGHGEGHLPPRDR